MVERIVCLILGTSALVGFVALTMENLPLNPADVMAFVTMLGLFGGTLVFPSFQVRFNAREQKLFYCREQWGCNWERQCDFAGIKSLRRVERYGTGEIGLRVHFCLSVGGEELPLPDASPQEADELEARLRALLPGCPFETSSPLEKAEMPPLSSGVDRTLELLPDGALIVRKDELSTRIMFLCFGILSFGTGMYCFDIFSTFQIVGFFLTALACVVGSLVPDSFEFEFDPGQRHLTLIEEIGVFERKRTFGFEAIRAIRREGWTIEEDDAPPRERFHLFLQIGEEERKLSPKELSRAQADELQNAVINVLGTPVPLLICRKNN